ncbi:hypothetical protein EUGRSUZ_G01020 [Eucalyptus grandis]|uniref:Uncharacterized protein n=2 Tax=Eucalyptus grandis TaxID=71139 RepID=A0ACC3K2K9_EUCGR|nr:hypothetical protein EUGRSUZ_G01020 [Eucalyptus grandis]
MKPKIALFLHTFLFFYTASRRATLYLDLSTFFLFLSDYPNHLVSLLITPSKLGVFIVFFLHATTLKLDSVACLPFLLEKSILRFTESRLSVRVMKEASKTVSRNGVVWPNRSCNEIILILCHVE